mgnify:CR=1 FL=1
MLRYQAQLFWLGVLLLLLLISLSLATGAGVYGGREVAGFLLGDPALVADEKLAMIVHTLRLPRTLAALVVGVCLALAASMLQSATRNPLAEPGLLGVNAGAVFALVIGLTYFGVESAYGYLLWSGMGALLGNLIVLGLGLMVGRSNPLKLILVGVALSATFGGLSNFLLLSNRVVLEQFRFWNLGSLAASSLESVLTVTPFALAALLLTLALCRQLTLMQMGDNQALALGRDLTDAEHAARITKVAVQDRGAVDVDDVALVQHVRIAGDAVTDHVVDRGANALGVALIVEVGRRAAVLDGVVVDHLVDLVGGHARGDVLAYVIEHAHVDGGRALDALDVGGRLVERAGQNLPALFPQALKALIKGAMAFLIFFAAAAPASVVAAGYGSFVIHG